MSAPIKGINLTGGDPLQDATNLAAIQNQVVPVEQNIKGCSVEIEKSKLFRSRF